MIIKLKSCLILLLCLCLAFSTAGCIDINDMFRKLPPEDENDFDQNDDLDISPKTPVPYETYENLSGWTVMIYLNGSNLESEAGEATANLNSLLSVPIPPNVNVLIYTGGTKKWHTDPISARKNQIWEVKDRSLKLLRSMEQKSMGRSETLAEFLSFGQTLYPGTRRALFLWNHGAGSIAGFGYDEIFDGDELYLSEIKNAFALSFDGQKYDIVGFDACLMACIEAAGILVPYAKYMVASEETEPGGGWNYEYTFGSLRDNPNMTGMELGIAVTDGYYKKYEFTEWESMTTCSVIDLEKIPALVEKLGKFSTSLTNDIKVPEKLSTIAYARQRTESYGESPGSVSYDLVDLYNFVELQKDLNPKLSDGLLSAIEDAVVYEVRGSQRINSYGLSIYFPFSATEYFSFCLDIYEDLAFCEEYYEFISAFASQLTSEAYLGFMPDYEPKLEETGHHDPFDEQPLYYVQLTDEEWEYMSYVYCTLGWAINDDVVLDLGFDSDVKIDYTQIYKCSEAPCQQTGQAVFTI